MIGAAICELMDEQGISMKGEDDRLVLGEEVIEILVA